MADNNDGLKVPLRTAVVLVMCLCVGAVVCGLSVIGGAHWAIAVIAGGGAAGSAAVFFDWLID